MESTGNTEGASPLGLNPEQLWVGIGDDPIKKIIQSTDPLSLAQLMNLGMEEGRVLTKYLEQYPSMRSHVVHKVVEFLREPAYAKSPELQKVINALIETLWNELYSLPQHYSKLSSQMRDVKQRCLREIERADEVIQYEMSRQGSTIDEYLDEQDDPATARKQETSETATSALGAQRNAIETATEGRSQGLSNAIGPAEDVSSGDAYNRSLPAQRFSEYLVGPKAGPLRFQIGFQANLWANDIVAGVRKKASFETDVLAFLQALKTSNPIGAKDLTPLNLYQACRGVLEVSLETQKLSQSDAKEENLASIREAISLVETCILPTLRQNASASRVVLGTDLWSHLSTAPEGHGVHNRGPDLPGDVYSGQSAQTELRKTAAQQGVDRLIALVEPGPTREDLGFPSGRKDHALLSPYSNNFFATDDPINISSDNPSKEGFEKKLLGLREGQKKLSQAATALLQRIHQEGRVASMEEFSEVAGAMEELARARDLLEVFVECGQDPQSSVMLKALLKKSQAALKQQEGDLKKVHAELIIDLQMRVQVLHKQVQYLQKLHVPKDIQKAIKSYRAKILAVDKLLAQGASKPIFARKGVRFGLENIALMNAVTELQNDDTILQAIQTASASESENPRPKRSAGPSVPSDRSASLLCALYKSELTKKKDALLALLHSDALDKSGSTLNSDSVDRHGSADGERQSVTNPRNSRLSSGEYALAPRQDAVASIDSPVSQSDRRHSDSVVIAAFHLDAVELYQSACLQYSWEVGQKDYSQGEVLDSQIQTDWHDLQQQLESSGVSYRSLGSGYTRSFTYDVAFREPIDDKGASVQSSRDSGDSEPSDGASEQPSSQSWEGLDLLTWMAVCLDWIASWLRQASPSLEQAAVQTRDLDAAKDMGEAINSVKKGLPVPCITSLAQGAAMRKVEREEGWSQKEGNDDGCCF